jgi:tetratricopeptide (TPR) repeat protein
MGRDLTTEQGVEDVRTERPGRAKAMDYHELAVPRRLPALRARPFLPGLVLCTVLASRGVAAAESDPAAPFDRAISTAESALQRGELPAAEASYRSTLYQGWLLLGALEQAEGRLPLARAAFEKASTGALDNTTALQGLALVQLQLGESVQAADVLARLSKKSPRDVKTRRLLAQALLANGQAAPAVQEFEAARAMAPDDLELAFAMAGAYLELKKPDSAGRLFAQIAEARPIPQTHVLIGRTYRDFLDYDRARAELRAALKQDPGVHHAHYYLGNILVAEKGMAGLEEAIPEFRAELKLARQDPLANLELGMALVDTQRPEEALAPLEIAARSGPPQPRTLYYLGRAQLGADKRAEAVASLRGALDLAQQQGAGGDRLRVIHNQLGQALRRLGETQEASAHFAEAERLSGQGSEVARAEMTRYLADDSGPEAGQRAVASLVEISPLATLAPAARQQLSGRVRTGLARSYLNLGVMQAQSQRFAKAAELLEEAATVDPDFPQIQRSLGIAYFSAQEFEKASGPLTRALAADPQDAGLKRMLAMAWLNAQKYREAADLMREDPELATDPKLQFAYGLALSKSERTAEAERVFSRLLTQHGDSAELHVLLGKAHAQKGDFDAAIQSLEQALRLQADVAEANGALGVIYLRQGRLPEAEQALRAELKAHPKDLQSRQNLAVVLDSQQRPEAAIPLLRSALQQKPDFADARYLLGKILLAQGAASEAVEHLEAAARLAPEDAKIHYQLGQAYQRLGRAPLAEREFERFRELKEKRPDGAP